MTAKRTGERAADRAWSSALAERFGRLWRRRISGPAFETPAADVDRDRRLKTVEARLVHLETALEGLQDALYRHQVLDEENIGELRKRTDPEQLARALSDDARRRGL
jgi:hypothetical protein